MTPEDINKTAWEVWARAPEDVRAKAQAVWTSISNQRSDGVRVDPVSILAAALMEEREAAAKIADKFPDIVMQLVGRPGGPPGNFVRGLRGSDIADAIRNPQTP